MGKMKKMKAMKKAKSLPLSQQLTEDENVKSKGRVKSRNRQDEDETVIDAKLSKKILASARQQQDELEEECGTSGHKVRARVPNLSTDDGDSFGSSESESDFEDDGGDAGNYQYVQIDENDEREFSYFMNPDPVKTRTLADLIMEKITEKQTELQSQFSDAQNVQMNDVDERVEEVFKGVGKVLSVYRSGKLPKAFKIIPSLSNWEQVLYITNPEKYTAASMYMATRMFASNFKENAAQRFFNTVLLPRVRDDIDEFKRLNPHLYLAVRKALFKPGAFYKGILLPLCESGTCTLREAVIISGIIAKNSIPLLHSAAALLKLAEMDYNGANSIFIQTLIRKKYALPYRVIDGLVHHFIKFRFDKRTLPVLWHQSLLAFVELYKHDISEDQKDALKDLIRKHFHPKITHEIRRELQDSKSRGETDVNMSTEVN